MAKRASRNAPCPCGSGKKYKRCCLGKGEPRNGVSAPHRRTAEVSVDSLRNKIMRFVEKKDILDRVPEAIARYCGVTTNKLHELELEQEEVLGFTEWFVHDFVLSDYGMPPIAAYLKSNPRLSPEERRILEDWQQTNLSVYQVTDIEAGYGVHVEDIFSKEKFFFHDVSLSQSVKVWELVICRKVWVLDEWQVSAVATKLMPGDKRDIHEFVMARYRDYLRDYPEARISEFLHRRGHLLHQFIINKELETPILPKLVTSHGDEIVYYEALYDIVYYARVIEKLSKVADYEMIESKKNAKGEVVQYNFDWLERGNSANLFDEELPTEGYGVSSFYIGGPGEEQYLLLGRVEVTPKRLRLSVTGEKRFEAGKEVLARTLGDAIRHRIEGMETLESRLSKETKRDTEPEALDPEVRSRLLKGALDDHYRRWLDMRIPALKNQTPRQASKTKEGRKELEDLLRVLEHGERLRVERGESEYDVSWIRRELNMDKG